MALEVRVLGRVDARIDGESVPLGGSKLRAVLAILALYANRTVSTDELIDGLWADRPPASAAKNVQLYVSRIRKAIGTDAGARIITHGRGYEFELAEDAVDAIHFERLVERARNEAERGIADGAVQRALDLWGGAPLADVAEEPFAAAEIRRLEELHLRAIELAIDAELAAGRAGETIAELEALVGRHPLHERFHAQRMLALYRAGRQSEALDAYREARGILIAEIGVEPGPELRELQEAVLRQDPALDGPPPVQELPRPLTEGSPILAGRDRELRWLRRRWWGAESPGVHVALLSGPPGIGKTRLAAALADEARRDGARVLYAAGGDERDRALAAVSEAEQSEHRTLFVLDDADDAPPTVLHAAHALVSRSRDSPLFLLVLHQDEQGPPAFASLEASGAAQRLHLGALHPEALADIAELYAPADGTAMPLEAVIAESAGVPLRAHRAASDWAQVQAAERLEATADRARGERGSHRAAELELAGSVGDLQAARERSHLYRADHPIDPAAPDVCPFRGLAPFDAAHAEYFFGRERLIAQLVARLAGSSLIAVVGPSGSGKSSLVRAGLLPSLSSGVLPGAERWRQVLVRPGERPIAELARALNGNGTRPGSNGAGGAERISDAADSLRSGERLVLAVDQCEEVFTACHSVSEREEFIAALVAAAEDPEQRVVVVLAIRADFYGRCAEYPELSGLMSANNILVGPMRREELRRAIELPARRAGLVAEPRLVTALVGDVADEPGGLPLLSTTLVELWEERGGRTLRRASYEATGGLSRAVARLAERAYGRLTPAHRERARTILLRLTEAGEDEPVRRRVPLAELEADRDSETAAVLAVLTEGRLLTADRETVEVAHEALLREWPRLREWLAEDVEGRRLHQHLIGAAAEWERSGREPGELYRGARLAAALEWASDHNGQLNEREREFLDESNAESEREAERQRRMNRRLRSALVGVGALLAAAVVAGLIALSERGSARDAATAEAAQRLGAEAQIEPRLDRALRTANAGFALEDSLATRSNLLRALLQSPAALGVLEVDGLPLIRLALSPDGGTLAVGQVDGTVALFDAATRARLGQYDPPGELSTLAFAPDGEALALGGHRQEPDEPGYVHIVATETQELRRSITVRPPRKEPDAFVEPSVAFAPDGRSVVVGYAIDLTFSPGPSFLQRFDASSGAEIGRPIEVPPITSWSALIRAPDGRFLYAGEDASYAIDGGTLRVARRYQGAGAPTAGLSPDGDTLALGGRDGRVRLLDLETGKVSRLNGGHRQPVVSAAFTPDGTTLTTGAEGGGVIVWDLRLGRAIETLDGHDGDLLAQTISPDGRTLYTSSADGTGIAWDLGGERRFGSRFATGFVQVTEDRMPPAFAVSPDGATVAVARLEGRVDLIDGQTLRRRASFETFEDSPVRAIEYSPDGERLAVVGDRGLLAVFDSGSGERVGDLLREPRGVCADQGSTYAVPRCFKAGSQSVAFGPEGRTLAVGEMGGRVRIWNLDRRQPIRQLGQLPPFLPALALAPDGSRLAVAFGFGNPRRHGVAIYDPESGERVTTLRTEGEPRAFDFSPDGLLLVSGQSDGSVLRWSTENWDRVGPPLTHDGSLITVSFSPDGRGLATTSSDGTAALWDLASGERIGPLLPHMADRRDRSIPGAERWNTARFTPDGRRLFVVFDNGHAVRWELDPAPWRRHACNVGGGGLTPDEWERLLPEQDFLDSCTSG